MKLRALILLIGALAFQVASAEVEHVGVGSANYFVNVKNDSWQPDGFEQGMIVPANWVEQPDIVLDGVDEERAWSDATEVVVPLYRGGVDKAWVKAVYTDEEVFIRVRWKDETEDREHHPWVWDEAKDAYVEGPQVEDSVMLSFEAGCEWSPSFLSGYPFDFDGWHWLAARTDPTGKAVDLNGNVKDLDRSNLGFVGYPTRFDEDFWIVKFVDKRPDKMHLEWDELDRVYMVQEPLATTWYRALPDGTGEIEYVEQLAPPATSEKKQQPIAPQYSPIPFDGQAAEVSAKGTWSDGYWTVEFRRARETPARTINDVVFERLTQFSVHVWDREEAIDASSESERLLLKFQPPQPQLASQ